MSSPFPKIFRGLRPNGPGPRHVPRPKGIGDYTDPLYNYTGAPPAGGAILGPVQAPTEFGDGEAPADVTEDKQMQRLAYNIWMEARRQGLSVIPREGQFFSVSNGETSVADGASGIVATFEVPVDFVGNLTRILLYVPATPSFPDVTWQLNINKVPYQFFNNYVATQYTNDIKPDVLEITSGHVYDLLATNNSGGGLPITCVGVLGGWIEYRSEEKPFGSSPANGA